MRVWVWVLVLLAACRPSEVLKSASPAPPDAKVALGEDDECHLSGEDVEPLTVDLPEQDRAKIETLPAEGTVVFRYGCDGLEVLPNCRVEEGSYHYVGFTPKERLMRLEDEDEVRAGLPTMGGAWAVKLSGELKQGTSLDIALMSVGQRTTSVMEVSPEQLRGDCGEATHFLKRAYVGAFAIETGSRAEARSAVDILGAGASGKASTSSFERVADGRVDACRDAKTDDDAPPEGCGAVLRVQLVPIGTVDVAQLEPGESCPEGMFAQTTICVRDTPLNRCRYGDTELCHRLCGQGDEDACFRAAIVTPGEPGMLKLRELCDDKDHTDACAAYATRLRDIDRLAPLPYWKKLCAGGEWPSECRYFAEALLASKGEAATQADRKEALDAMERGCALGDAQACLAAGHTYLEPDPAQRAVEPDERKALSLFIEACIAAHYNCSAAAQLLDGTSWCDITYRDPSLCRGEMPGDTVAVDRSRAVVLHRKACTSSAKSCLALLAHGEFDRAVVGPANYARDDACPAEPPVAEMARLDRVDDCLVASRLAAQNGDQTEAKRRRAAACEAATYLKTKRADVCGDPSDRNANIACVQLRQSLEYAAQACGE